MTKNRQLKRKALSSAIWTWIRFGAEQATSLVIFVILARMLTPQDLGIFAIALVFSEFGKMISTAGLPDIIVREQENNADFFSTVFVTNFVLALLVAIGLCVTAPLYAQAFGEPLVQPVLTALALLVPIGALGQVHSAIILREFGHRTIAIRTVVASVMGGICGIVMAIMGAGVWSLLGQRLVSELVTALLSWYAYRWMPSIRVKTIYLGRIFKFSSNLIFVQLNWFLMVRSQDIIVARMLGVSLVGVNRVAWRSIDLLTQSTISPLVTAALPTFARLSHDRESFVRALIRMLAVTSFFTFPVMLGFGAVAEEAVPLIFGQQWREAGSVATILALLGPPLLLNSFVSPALAAIGRPGIIMKLSFVQLILTVILTSIAAFWGLWAVALAYVVRAYITTPLVLRIFMQEVGTNTGDVLRAIAPQFVASAVMAGSVWFIGKALLARGSDPLFVIMTLVILGSVFYGMLVLIFLRKIFMNHVSFIRDTIAKT